MKKKLLLVLSVLFTIGIAVVVVFIGLKANDSNEPSGSLLPSVGQEHGIKLATTTEEDGSILVTAKITPENATLKKLNWSVYWKNFDETIPEDQTEWKENKNLDQFIQLTTTDNTCRVKCLQAFGYPITLKCKSVNGSASATCQLDYVKRITNYAPKFQDQNNAQILYSNDVIEFDFDAGAVLYMLNTYGSIEEQEADMATWYTYGVGTVNDTYSMEYTVTLDSDLYRVLVEGHNITGTARQSKTFTGEVRLNLGSTFMHDFFGLDPVEGQSLDEFLDEVRQATVDETNDGNNVFDLTITLKGTYSTFEKTIKVVRGGWNYGTYIQSIELTESNLFF